MSSQIKKIFIDWRKPCLPEVARHLLSYPVSGNTLDLSKLTIVLQVGRAGRRLLELLALECEARGLLLVPPRTITVGGFPEAVLTLERAPASEAECMTAWSEALRKFERERLSCVIPNPPAKEDFLSWLKLGRRLHALYSELAAACLSFEDVVKSVNKLPEFVEAERWTVLSEIRHGYREELEQAGLRDRHELRAGAIKSAADFDGEILLVAAFDLNQLSRRILAELSCSVTAIVHSGEAEREAFDDQGCLIREKWLTHGVTVRDESIILVRGPEEHAQAVVDAVAHLARGRPPEEIAIGALDRQLVPYLRESLKQAGVSTRYAGGVPVTAASPYLLLKLLASYLNGGSYFDFATLLRHADIQHWLGSLDPDFSVTGALQASDRFQSEHLHAGFKLEEAAQDILGPKAAQAFEALFRELSGKAPLREWSLRIANFLTGIYAGRKLQRHGQGERLIVESLELIRNGLEECFEIPPSLQVTLSGYEAVRVILFLLRSEAIPPEQKDAAAEILGWLELQLDDSPALVISGVNEGLLPESVNEDIFLPNAARSALGLLDNAARFVRDVYALNAILAGRSEAVLIASHFSAQGDDLMLSRLLLSCPPQTMARRLLDFSKAASAAPAPRAKRGTANADAFKAARPPAPLPNPLSAVSVTALKTYLECPYRFYLRHVLGLGDLDDRASEMDGALFGDLIHQVLCDFGKSPHAGSKNRDEIERCVTDALERRFMLRHGKHPLPAVQIQKHQLLERLKRFADWQARWAAAGWVIKECEHDFKGEDFTVECKDGRLSIRGRIDRIDFNPAINQWLVIDYKTGEGQDDLRKSHLSKAGWRDLQLPVYQRYFERKQPTAQVDTAYLLINGSGDLPDLQRADWTGEELCAAQKCLEDIAEKIRAGIFWPPSEARTSFDAFKGILGTDCLIEEPAWEE